MFANVNLLIRHGARRSKPGSHGGRAISLTAAGATLTPGAADVQRTRVYLGDVQLPDMDRRGTHPGTPTRPPTDRPPTVHQPSTNRQS